MFLRATTVILAAILFTTVTTFQCAFAENPKLEQSNKAAEPCIEKAKKALGEKQLDKALAEFKACVEQHPNSTAARFGLGMAYFMAKDAKAATNEFLEVRKLDPENLDAQAMLARLYSFDKDKLDLAQELLERCLKVRPDSLDLRFDLARVYAQKGEIQKSFGEFAFILDFEGKFAMYRTELAKVLLAGDEKEGAKEMLKRALVIDPNFAPARELLKQVEAGGPEKQGK
jgi:Tfp pilus assembly protein PilF